MNRRVALIAALFSTLGLVATEASAQTIRSYGDKAESAYGAQQGGTTGNRSVYTPGAPLPPPPASNSGSPNAKAEGGEAKEDGKEEAAGNYVTVFQSGAFNQKPVEALNLTETEMYRGIIPGKRDSVAHLSSDGTGDNRITWIGFQAKDDSSRVFFQTTRAADYQIVSGDASNVLVVRFANTKIPVRNFKRFIDTSAFDWNVRRIDARQASKEVVEVTIELESDEEPIISRNGGYLYLDFKKKSQNKSDETS